MATPPPIPAELSRRLDALVVRAQALEVDGLPFPIQQVRDAVTGALAIGTTAKAEQVLKRGEALLEKVSRDWIWVKELLRRADELRAIAGTIGVDLALLDSRVGNPRNKLKAEGLSSGSLEKAAASASLALAVLNDAVPKFCVQEAQKLGDSIRNARDRGEDVTEPAAAFSRLLIAIQDQNLPTSAQRLVETRKAVAHIPRAPALPARMSNEEEDEILLEARNLARRLQRIKGKAHDAHSAARLMSQVRAALSEDRRYGTPEEEIETLWLEVDRMTRENRRAAETPVAGSGRERDDRPASDVVPRAAPLDDLDISRTAAAQAKASGGSKPAGSAPESDIPVPSRRGFLVPYVPPEMPLPAGPEDTGDPPARSRNRPRIPP
ncbi:MAG: hypothetical protein WB809_07425 [Thermoplasmata archaeon]